MLLHHLRKKYILILLHLLVLSSEGHRKSKKARDLKISPPKYELYHSDTLPSDVQVTKYLLKEKLERFSYRSALTNGTLSVTIIPCSSLIKWSFTLANSNDEENSKVYVEEYATNNITTKTFTSSKGLYILSLKAMENDTFVHIYISTEFGGPQALQTSHADNLRLHQRQKQKSASLKWNQSLVDPQSTEYCLVISKNKIYNSLCAAQATGLYLQPPPSQNSLHRPTSDSQTIKVWESPKDNYIDAEDPLIACTGKKTQYTISNLREGQLYYYNLFAINKQSNLTYPFGSVSRIFKSQTKPLSLKNGFRLANLKGPDDKVVFRYKIGRNAKNDFEVFIIPCGGPVDVKIMLKDQTVATAKNIEGFEKMIVERPVKTARYLIKVFTKNGEDFRRAAAVQIFASTKALSKIPFITQGKLKEYKSLRECNSVTIGWILVPEHRNLHYCVKVKEGKLKDMEDYKIPNQCGLENRLRKSEDYVTKYCKDITRNNVKVNTYKIRELEQGRNYIVQVTVKKHKGITLSYELLQVSTKKCGKRHN